MKTRASIVARTCRLQEWAQMVQECNQRPVGMSVSEWCQANSITKANYYYRMTQVRKACLDSIPDGVIERLRYSFCSIYRLEIYYGSSFYHKTPVPRGT